MTDFQAIIFDYDGTLVDLRATAWQMDSLRAEVRACFGESGTGLAFQPFYPDIDSALARLVQQTPQTVMATREQLNAIIVRYEEKFAEVSDAKPFASAVWRAAVRKSRVGIVSNNAASCIPPTLERHQIASVSDRFDVVGFEDLERHKPYPDGLSRITHSLGLTRGHRALYVGDHCDDLEACYRFNALDGPQLLPFIVKGGKCNWERIVSHPYFRESVAIADLSELVPVLSHREQVNGGE